MPFATPSHLAAWYEQHGRHDLPWRIPRDRWSVLVAEVMLQQTQVARVLLVYDAFLAQFPTPQAASAAGPAALIRAWGRLGYPRRAKRLFDAAQQVTSGGWPENLEDLPGVGRYTAAAIAAQVDNADRVGVDVNIQRVVERVRGSRLSVRDAEVAAVEVGAGLTGRDRFLALMDLGAMICTARSPDCDRCPLYAVCQTHGVLPDVQKQRQGRFEGSMRQRRGLVMARLRAEPSVKVSELDG